MNEILMLANPRKRRGRKSYRRSYRRNPIPAVLANPRRRRSSLSSGGANSSRNVWTAIVPVGVGVGVGLVMPKVMKLTGVAKWIVPIGIGLAGNVVLRGVVGGRTANLFSAGVLASVVLYALDEIVFKKQGIPVLGDAERVVSMGDNEVEVVSAEDMPELSDAEVSADDMPELSASENEEVFSRY